MNNCKPLPVIVVLCLLLVGLPAAAKEDTVYLSFRKSALSRPGTIVYTVKKGEWLLDIVQRVTGESKKRLGIIRKYNPEIKDLNRIYPGQRLVLPVRKTDGAVPAAGSTAISVASTQAPAFLSAAEAFPSPDKWLLIRQLLHRIGASVVDQGKYYLPLSGMGQLTVDCRKIPLVEFADRGMVFTDFRGQLPENVVQLVRRAWKNVLIIRIDPRLSAPEILAQLIGASGTHEMTKRETPLNIGDQPLLQIPPAWTIVPKDGAVSAQKGKNIALWLRTEESPPLPGLVKSHASGKGWEIVEIAADKILAPRPDENMTPRSAARLSSRSHTEMIVDLCRILEVPTTREASLKIFDTRRDGFDLTVKTDLLIARGDKRLIVMERRLPNQFIGILQSGQTEVLHPQTGETRTSFLARFCRAMGLTYVSGPFHLPLATTGDLAAAHISLSGLKITTDKGAVIYLTDFDPGEHLTGYLAQAVGVMVVSY